MSGAHAERGVSIPDTLESPQAKLVYVYLAFAEEATAAELQRALDLSKLTLFSVLDSLEAKNAVRETEGGYACR